ncbi:MAG: hypothetical protein HYZ28_00195 [Myxococcales bacterium]|nr:hypothetical protein [Myxococcales bacterium]
MAIPPEPIDEVIPDASAAVIAEVARIVVQDLQERAPKAPPDATDVPGKAARQVVELRVKEVLFGKLAGPGMTVQAIKPAGDYALREGNRGPFLLKAPKPGQSEPEILGRYGPDTYSTSLIKTAAQRHKKG